MDPGFQKRKRKERLYDMMHRGAVRVCMGVTVVGSLLLGYKVYEYFRYIRPLHLAQSKLAQDELLREGRNIEDSPNIELST
ncbi:uncharacterized protein LOC105206760 [Solenopsis invicta]|uniref:uncharacterized protein LOC105206760 n=1 Tax=Solenopsis invicta TaxID=13686 RepID=UPI0005961FAA|nr:uncharacterized protein LOC105206760 [Solenopsis invicta]XP_011174533.1 uncharacterized protein LOC105206760 [Solenopsis invicta]